MAIRPNAAYYVTFIDAVWEGVLSATLYDINQEVEDLCNRVYKSIRDCSQAMLALDTTWSLFWTTSDFWGLIPSVAISGAFSLPGWIAYIQGHTSYRTCVLNAAIHYKSPMAIALLNLWGYSASQAADALKARGIEISDKEIEEGFSKLKVLMPNKAE